MTTLPINQQLLNGFDTRSLLSAANRLETGSFAVSTLFPSGKISPKASSLGILSPSLSTAVPTVKGEADSPTTLEGFIQKFGSKKNLVDLNAVLSLNSFEDNGTFSALSGKLQNALLNYGSAKNFNEPTGLNQLI